jgi:hypothetical protein
LFRIRCCRPAWRGGYLLAVSQGIFLFALKNHTAVLINAVYVILYNGANICTASVVSYVYVLVLSEQHWVLIRLVLLDRTGFFTVKRNKNCIECILDERFYVFFCSSTFIILFWRSKKEQRNTTNLKCHFFPSDK